MITDDDLILAENAMQKSEEQIGYCLRGITGRRFVSTSFEKVFEEAKTETIFKYLVIYSYNEENILKKIKIDKIKNVVDSEFIIYIATPKDIKKYKI